MKIFGQTVILTRKEGFLKTVKLSRIPIRRYKRKYGLENLELDI